MAKPLEQLEDEGHIIHLRYSHIWWRLVHYILR